MHEEWFSQFKRGDEKAYEQVFELHYRSILYYAMQILKQDSYAEDIATFAFFQAWENRNKIESPSHLRNYLFKVARSASVSYLRKGKTNLKTATAWTKLFPESEGLTNSIDLEKVQTLLIEQIYNAMQKMPGGEILRMTYLEGKSTQQIAEELNVTENTIYIARSRAIRRLREQFKDNSLLLLLLFGLNIRSITSKSLHRHNFICRREVTILIENSISSHSARMYEIGCAATVTAS